MARPTLLDEALLEKARGYLDMCKDTYRRFDEVQEDEDQQIVQGMDELYTEAVSYVRAQGTASTSHLQRVLHVGYSRAARLMDLMEKYSVIGPINGPAPREVLSPDLEIEPPVDLELDEDRPKRYRASFQSQSRLDVKLPNIAGLAVYLGVARESVRKWANPESDVFNEEFMGIVEEVLAEQENRLITGGISGSYNPTIAKLILTKHGYTDKVDHTTKDQPLQPSAEAVAIASKALDNFLNPNGD